VNPEWAAQLTHRIQTYFDNNKEVIGEESPNDEEIEWTQEDTNTDTGVVSIYTGTLDTGWLVELDYILTNDTTQNEEPITEEETEEPEEEVVAEDDNQEETETQEDPKPSSNSSTGSSQSSSSLSAQDKEDMKNFLNAIVE